MTDLSIGRLKGFTIDLLFALVGKLDHHVEIRVSLKSVSQTTEIIHVAQI